MKTAFLFLMICMCATATEHGPVVTKILTDTQLKPGDTNVTAAVERVINARDQVLSQASAYHVDKTWQPPEGTDELNNLVVTFGELASLPDDTLIPVTDKGLLLSPQDAYKNVHLRKKDGQETSSYILATTYELLPGGAMHAEVLVQHGHISQTVGLPRNPMVRWGDIKDRVAVEFTPRREGELAKMKGIAMRQAGYTGPVF